MLSNGSAQLLDSAGLDEQLQVEVWALNADYLTTCLGSASQLVYSANGQAKIWLGCTSYGTLEGESSPLVASPSIYSTRDGDGGNLLDIAQKIVPIGCTSFLGFALVTFLGSTSS
ncbi:MAG: hypothetical protein K0Q50_1226 [Vampirovibrio sp.]|jgi:hypothetical protein|nr:hypothetical protein [Vampirovibrio sp.]